jgi:hypothetical protein
MFVEQIDSGLVSRQATHKLPKDSITAVEHSSMIAAETKVGDIDANRLARITIGTIRLIDELTRAAMSERQSAIRVFQRDRADGHL